MGHDRGARREGLLHVEHGGQLLEVEAHRGGRLDRGRLGLGEDRDDRLAHVAHAIDGEDELLLGLDADQAEDRVHVVRHVLVGQRADVALDPLRPGQVDTADPGVVEGAADHPQVEHPREGEVGGVRRAAGDEADAVAALDRLADDVEVRRHRPASAAAAIASTIGS